MRILHLLYESKHDVFGIGGVGIRAYNIYKHLRDRHDITLLCKRYPGAEDSEITGLKHIFVGTESRSLTKTLLSFAFNARRYVMENGSKYDVIIEEFSPAIPTFLNQYNKRPVVLQIQGYTGVKYFAKYNPLYSTVLYLSEYFRPGYYRNVILVSEKTKRRLSLRNAQNIWVISNGISEDYFFAERKESNYFLYLGRIDIHHKGLDILLKAFRYFAEEDGKTRLVIAGHGRDIEKLEQIISGIPDSIRQRIELKGWVDGDLKISLLSGAIAVIMPSRYETQGIVALESMASGSPLIASDIPELSYISDSGAGTLFKAGDAKELYKSLCNIVKYSNRNEMGSAGRKWVKNLTWENIANRFEDVLKEVV